MHDMRERENLAFLKNTTVFQAEALAKATDFARAGAQLIPQEGIRARIEARVIPAIESLKTPSQESLDTMRWLEGIETDGVVKEDGAEKLWKIWEGNAPEKDVAESESMKKHSFVDKLVPRVTSKLTNRYLRLIVNDNDALRFLLKLSADAESNGEGLVFERVRDFVPDEYKEKVDRHASDEIRHEQIFSDAYKSINSNIDEEIPQDLRLIDRVSTATGNILSREVHSISDVGVAYLFLLAIERRAYEQIGLIEEALQAKYPDIANIVTTIREDEFGHIKFCKKISQIAIPNDDIRQVLEDEIAKSEAEAFREQKHAFVAYAERFLATMSFPEKLFWRMMLKVDDLIGKPEQMVLKTP